jgi:hypothetical protein
MGHVSYVYEMRNVHKFVGHKGKVALGRRSHKWQDNTEMYLNEVGWGNVDWVLVVQS